MYIAHVKSLIIKYCYFLDIIQGCKVIEFRDIKHLAGIQAGSQLILYAGYRKDRASCVIQYTYEVVDNIIYIHIHAVSDVRNSKLLYDVVSISHYASVLI